MKRIVCIGNRYIGDDDVGPRVHDALCSMSLPDGVEVVDGGLGGLNLLRCLDGASRVVFVDALAGFGEPGSVRVLRGERVASWAQGGYDHAAGLPYLLRMAPAACEGPMPTVLVVGVEAPAGGAMVQAAAACALRAVQGELDNQAVFERGVA